VTIATDRSHELMPISLISAASSRHVAAGVGPAAGFSERLIAADARTKARNN
jgi:hypothetical protein